MRSNSFVLRALMLGLVAGAFGAASAARFAGIEVPPPPPPKPVVDVHWGVKVEDPYRFFENTKDPAVAAWMKAQAQATQSILERIPGRAPLLTRIREVESQAPGLAINVMRTPNGRFFFQKRDPQDNQFRLVSRAQVDGPDQLILDPEELTKKAGTPHAIMDFAPSPDGRRIAYAVQAGGGEIGTLHVVDLDSGKELITPVDGIRYSNVAWLDDSSGFFYSRLKDGYEKLPPQQRFADRTRHFRSLAAPEADRKVFSPSLNAELKLPDYASGYIFQIPDTRLAGMLVFLGVERHRLFYLADLEEAKLGKARWRSVVTAADQAHEALPGGGYLYVRTSKGAPRFRVLRTPLDAPDLSKAEVVVPASESVVTDIAPARDGVYVARRDGVTHSLWRLPHTAAPKMERIELPFEGSVEMSTWGDRDGVVLSLAGWTRATRPYLFDPGRPVTELPFVTPGALDAPDNLMAREVRVRSHDGVEVPLSIISRKNIKLDGSNPTIMYGYGAYGVTEDPFFNPRTLAWIERGGVYAIAHVRGGGAFGEEWHVAGRKQTKPNTWKDAIAVGQWLVDNGYTSKAKLGILGGSAGGIFVGRAITERPDLFAAAVPVVGTFDTPRFETSANGPANIPEFGTVKDEAEFKALMAMSTYHAISDGTRYPGILLVHGVNDIRVDVWQSLKAGARFATATTSGKPVLLRLEYDSGHGQGSTRLQLQERVADIWSFMLWQFGMPEFQPQVNDR